MFRLGFTLKAKAQLEALEADKSKAKQLKAVRKTLGLMETNIRHPGLNTHKFESLVGPEGEPVFEAYAENQTAAAFRVFWYYGPGKGAITVVAITPHP